MSFTEDQKLSIAVMMFAMLIFAGCIIWDMRVSMREGWLRPVYLGSLALASSLLFMARNFLHWLTVYLYKVTYLAGIQWYINRRRSQERAFEERQDRYQKLKADEIRILTIEAGITRHPLRCRMRIVKLGAETYEALSYTWGSALKRREISLNGSPFFITMNLDAALRHLRHDRQSRDIWIDAICINQFDLDERNGQVAIMRDIYQHASNVTVWLGELTTDTTLLSRCNALLGQLRSKPPTVASSQLAFAFMRDVQTGSLQEASVANTLCKDIYEVEWRAIRELFKRPYWQRMWIIQEICTASSITVQCGTEIVDWAIIVKLDSAWHEYRREHPTNQGRWFQSVDSSEVGPLRAFRAAAPGPYLLDKTRRAVMGKQKSAMTSAGNLQASLDATLLGLLQTFCLSRATDTRDQLFALVGIASDRELLGLKANYNATLSKVFGDFVIAMFEQTNRVDVLGYAGWIADEDSFGIGQETKSWVPNWSTDALSRLHLAQINLHCPYAASANSTACVSLEFPNLKIKGQITDRVMKLGRKSRHYKTSRLTNTELKRVADDLRAYYKFALKWLKILRERATGDCRDDFDLEQLNLESTSNHYTRWHLSNLWRVFVADRTVSGQEAPMEWAEQFAALVPEEASDRISVHDPIDFARPYLEAVLHTMSSRRFFITRDYRFGIGPTDVKEGDDQIVLFSGCNVPLILREVWINSGKRYGEGRKRIEGLDHLKGWTYVLGMMGGEEYKGEGEFRTWSL